MTLPPLFLYGTLRDPDILAAVLGRAMAEGDLVAAAAPDCAAVYFPGQLYPALVQRTGGSAPGLLLSRATADDMAALDAFEGDQYRRGPVLAATATALVAAEVYWPAIAVDPCSADWTLERWMRQHKPQVLLHETAMARAARLATARS
jgi:gamma-glutamylcyclotransferase (GGCT)/AIG2-like uncharacterized protein YtfP